MIGRSPMPILRRRFPIIRRQFIIGRRKFLIRRLPFHVYQPVWTGVFEQWSRNWVHANYWRVQHIVDSPEDALQECAIVFTKCRNRYFGTVNNPAWFMALYTRSVMNLWNTLSQRDRRAREAMSDYKEVELLELRAKEIIDHIGPWQVAIAQLSDQARIVLTILAQAPEKEITALFGKAPQRSMVHTRQIAQFFGLSLSTNVYTEICNLLGRRPTP